MRQMIARPWVVLLAAGASRRFGGPKLLARIGRETLLRRMARTALASGAAGCTVVLGARAARLVPELDDLPLQVAVNSRWRSGVASSLAAGIAAVPREAPAALVLLADQARIGPGELALLIAAWLKRPRSIVAASADGRLMPPVVLPRALFREMRALKGDRGARDLLRDRSRGVIAFEMPSAAGDLDRPADLAAIRRERALARGARSPRSSRARPPTSSGAT
jgi:molybdenum cofactor cytidylyltransferase